MKITRRSHSPETGSLSNQTHIRHTITNQPAIKSVLTGDTPANDCDCDRRSVHRLRPAAAAPPPVRSATGCSACCAIAPAISTNRLRHRVADFRAPVPASAATATPGAGRCCAAPTWTHCPPPATAIACARARAARSVKTVASNRTASAYTTGTGLVRRRVRAPATGHVDPFCGAPSPP